MTDIEIDASRLDRFLWIHETDDNDKPSGRSDEDWITAECNYCPIGSAVFYAGEDAFLPGSGWLELAATHVAEVHK